LSIFHFIDKKKCKCDNVSLANLRDPWWCVGSVKNIYWWQHIYIYISKHRQIIFYFFSLFYSNRKREIERKNDGIIISFYKGKKKTRTSKKKKKKRKIASIVLINRMKTFAYEYRYLRVNRISDSINKNRLTKNGT
jgi:hypothetical protein